jgi:Uma2 family endonuclease
MSTITPKKLLTAEEFFLLPDPDDGSQQELVRGEVVTMPPPGGMHGVACLRVARRIGNFVEDNNLGTVTSNDTGFITERSPDSVRGPDVAYWSKDRLPMVPVGYIEIAPDMLVEVLSPSNTSKQIRAKLKEYFATGVWLVWVIAPEDRTLTIYRTPDEGRVLHETATVSGEDVLPEFTCRVSDLLPS